MNWQGSPPTCSQIRNLGVICMIQFISSSNSLVEAEKDKYLCSKHFIYFLIVFTKSDPNCDDVVGLLERIGIRPNPNGKGSHKIHHFCVKRSSLPSFLLLSSDQARNRKRRKRRKRRQASDELDDVLYTSTCRRYCRRYR